MTNYYECIRDENEKLVITFKRDYSTSIFEAEVRVGEHVLMNCRTENMQVGTRNILEVLQDILHAPLKAKQ